VGFQNIRLYFLTPPQSLMAVDLIAGVKNIEL
jgi:hypothetical protein